MKMHSLPDFARDFPAQTGSAGLNAPVAACGSIYSQFLGLPGRSWRAQGRRKGQRSALVVYGGLGGQIKSVTKSLQQRVAAGRLIVWGQTEFAPASLGVAFLDAANQQTAGRQLTLVVASALTDALTG